MVMFILKRVIEGRKSLQKVVGIKRVMGMVLIAIWDIQMKMPIMAEIQKVMNIEAWIKEIRIGTPKNSVKIL